MTLLVAPSYGHGLLSVDYLVSGALDRNLTTYTDQAGQTSRLPALVNHDLHSYGGNAQSDSFSWAWDETSGNHTVDVHVVYEDGSTASKSLTVNAEAPTVDDFTVLGRSQEFGTFNSNWNHVQDPRFVYVIGFAQPDAEAEIYQAHFHNTTAFSSQFYFVQTVQATMSFKHSNGGTFSFTSVGKDLDSVGHIEYGVRTMVGAGGEGWLAPDNFRHQVTQRDGTIFNSPHISDSPRFTRSPMGNETGFVLTEVHMDWKFETNLVFQSTVSDSVPIVLSTVNWQMKGDAVLPLDSQNYAGQMNEASWNVVIAGDGTNQFWSKQGDNVRKLLQYSKNMEQDMADQAFPT